MKSLSFKSLSYLVLLDNNNYLIICPGVGYKCCILINNASTDEGVLLNTEFWFRYYMNPIIRGNPQFSATLTKTTDLISYPNTRKRSLQTSWTHYSKCCIKYWAKIYRKNANEEYSWVCSVLTYAREDPYFYEVSNISNKNSNFPRRAGACKNNVNKYWWCSKHPSPYPTSPLI